MKILVLSDLFPEFEGDWKGIYLIDYLQSLQGQCEVEVFNSKLIGSFKGEMMINHGDFFITQYRHQTSPSFVKLIAYQSWLRNSMQIAQRFKNVDLIHAHGSVLQGSLARKLAKEWNIPYVITEHTGPFSVITRSYFKKNWAKRAIENAELLMVVSGRLKNEISDAGIHAKKTLVTFNPIDTNTFKTGLKGPHKQIVFASRLDEFKGGLRTLKAFHEILGAYPDWHLAIIGDGEEYENIRNYIVQERLHKAVSLYGMLSKEEIYGVFKRSDFLVFPSRHESFGLVAAEAMATGIPVIVSKETGVAELINKKNGTKINPDNISEIAAAMRLMIPKLEQYNRDEIRERVFTHLGLAAFGKTLMREYQSCILRDATQLA